MSSKNKKLNLDYDTLYELYINQQMTSKEVADIFDCTSKSIRNYLKSFGIPIRANGELLSLNVPNDLMKKKKQDHVSLFKHGLIHQKILKKKSL